jgi:polar amino acid transport system substrate-binding protein
MVSRRLVIIGVAITALMSTPARADVLDNIKARQKLICGVTSDAPPWGYIDTQKQELIGYEIDLCRMVADSLGVPLELKNTTGASRVPELLQGRVDMLATVLTYSKERAEQIDLSGAYIRETFSFMVRQDSRIKSVDELAGKRIGVVSGSFLEPMIPKRLPTAAVVAFESQPANFLALQQGKVAASAMRYSQAKALEIGAGAGSRPLVALPGPLTTGASGFGVGKGETRLLEYLNGFLAKLESSGQGQALFDKWIGKDSSYGMIREFRFGEPLI